MKELVASFTDHLKTAIEIGTSSELKATESEIHNVMILGMGGSGIGGSVAAQVLWDELKVPVFSSKGYIIPAFVSEKTLVIVSSFSGNTEETLMALEQAEQKTSLICCICSGGKLEEKAKANNYNLIVIPGGIPPRAAFGLSFPQLFKVFDHYKLINFDVRSRFESCIDLIKTQESAIKEEAMNLAESLKDKRIIIYSQSNYEGVGVRFRQQINENSKKLCWHHVIPEMNHNELVGWREHNDELAVVILRNNDDHQRNQIRMDLSKEIIQKYTSNIFEIHSKGADTLQRSIYLIHLCDWISVYIAELNNTDPIEIEVINYLKSSLAKA